MDITSLPSSDTNQSRRPYISITRRSTFFSNKTSEGPNENLKYFMYHILIFSFSFSSPYICLILHSNRYSLPVTVSRLRSSASLPVTILNTPFKIKTHVIRAKNSM